MSSVSQPRNKCYDLGIANATPRTLSHACLPACLWPFLVSLSCLVCLWTGGLWQLTITIQRFRQEIFEGARKNQGRGEFKLLNPGIKFVS